jgi:hypothetical protein
MEHLEVKLGERAAGPAELREPVGWQPSQMRSLRPITGANEEEMWKSFDSLTLSRTDKDKFKAEIKYRDEQGKLETRDFKGTREQIRDDINAQRDLPANERQQLLRAISLSSNPWEAAFPYMEFIPNRGGLRDYGNTGPQTQ